MHDKLLNLVPLHHALDNGAGTGENQGPWKIVAGGARDGVKENAVEYREASPNNARKRPPAISSSGDSRHVQDNSVCIAESSAQAAQHVGDHVVRSLPRHEFRLGRSSSDHLTRPVGFPNCRMERRPFPRRPAQGIRCGPGSYAEGFDRRGLGISALSWLPLAIRG